jgi:osmoprotectant transport system ATP-binding protein
MIRYEKVTKIFGSGGKTVTAVDNVSFEVEKGDVVTLLGPSGCGKTTLLRLTNRLIPITRGKITVDGRDIMDTDPVKLRQSMGYAIQAVGLFPNKTIYGNIATVPRLLKWDKQRIQRRADELLTMLRLEPEKYRDRYPAELSGGQQQRIGVARCLAADPNILLMDEPFGAIDPINRVGIQDEFLRVQAKLKKTVIFVTHDLQEAIKMGDKIAIFDQGHLIQYDSPEMILTRPKNKYIADFVGADRGLQVLGLRKAKNAMVEAPYRLIEASTDTITALKFLRDNELNHATVIEKERPMGYVTPSMLKEKDGLVKKIAKHYPIQIYPYDSLKDVLSAMLMYNIRLLCVVDENHKLLGTISLEDIQTSIMEIYHQTQKDHFQCISGNL